jgi:hypothetical protein
MANPDARPGPGMDLFPAPDLEVSKPLPEEASRIPDPPARESLSAFPAP